MKLATLSYSVTAGEGRIRFSREFKEWPDRDVIKLDILQDWISELTTEYNRVILSGRKRSNQQE